MIRPRLGWYGDDFTGATDTLAALARAGQRALLFLGVPTLERLADAGPLDAVGIAGATRTMAPEAMRAELEPVGRFFRALGVPVMHYKCCSTFDSAPTVGSLAAAVAALRPSFPNRLVPIVGGQPNIGRYCLFATLFAAAGTGGAVHRIDRHPTMSRHPVTPMGEADLRRHLAAQGLEGVASLPYTDYALPPDALADRLDRLASEGSGAVLFDVARAEDLPVIGRLVGASARRAPLLAVGPSSVAQALCAATEKATEKAADYADTNAPTPFDLPAPGPAQGPVFIMAGSLSPVTRRQVEAATSYDRIPAEAGRLCADPAYARDLLDTVAHRLAMGRNVLVWTAPEDAATADTRRAADVAQATAVFTAAVARTLAGTVPLRRMGIAGGDTSSMAVQALGCWGLSYAATLAPGVTLSRVRHDDPALDGLELMLKGGQMGPPALFEILLRG